MQGWYRFKEQLHLAPHREGVYVLSTVDAENGLVYVGRADDLYQRLNSHPDPNNPLLQRVSISYFAFEETQNSEEMEGRLIRYYNPVCNRTN